MKIPSGVWTRFALFNLSVVALVGVVMRYKILYELPMVSQKYLQEAHSHFAFTGWITHCLFFLLVILFRSNLSQIHERRYALLISLNLLTAYGMLVSFSLQGYGPVSLTFSTASLINAFFFSWFAYKDTGRLSPDHPGRNWIRAAILFGVLSALGTVVLSHMMATRQYDQTTYLGSIYFYLHFQYNGWFLFACFGLLLDRLRHLGLDKKSMRTSFWLIALSAVPAYFLSTLWAKLPVWLYVLVVVAAFLQVWGWAILVRLFWKHRHPIQQLFGRLASGLMVVVALAFSFKLMLQLGSTHPEVSHITFGFRPIVIAYLHLVLLLIISLFLLAWLYSSVDLQRHWWAGLALVLFTIGILLNETVLGVQGIAAFSYTVIPYVQEALFGISLLLWGSALWLFLTQIRTQSR